MNQQMGTIMDAVSMSEANYQSRETMDAAIQNDQMKKLEALAKAWKEAHTTKVREHKKIGRNEPCPCGSLDKHGKPKKYKNCCLKTGKYESIVNKN